MKKSMATFFRVAALTCAAFAGFAQGAPQDSMPHSRSYWVFLGVANSGALFLVNAQVANSWLITAGRQYTSSFSQADGPYYNSFIGQVNGGASHSVDTEVYDVLAGKIATGKYSIISLSAGLSLAKVTTTDLCTFPFTGPSCFSMTNKSAVGIPILLQGYLVAFKTVGLGLSGYLNLNAAHTFGSVGLNLGIGYMDTHR